MHENMLNIKQLIRTNEEKFGEKERFGAPRSPPPRRVMKTKQQMDYELSLEAKARYKLRRDEESEVSEDISKDRSQNCHASWSCEVRCPRERRRSRSRGRGDGWRNIGTRACHGHAMTRMLCLWDVMCVNSVSERGREDHEKINEKSWGLSNAKNHNG